MASRKRKIHDGSKRRYLPFSGPLAVCSKLMAWSELVKKFKYNTGTQEDNLAYFFLEATGWNLEVRVFLPVPLILIDCHISKHKRCSTRAWYNFLWSYRLNFFHITNDGSKDDGSGEEDEVEVPIRDAYKNNDIQQRDEKETEKEEEEDQPATPPVKKTEKKKEKGKTRKGKQPKAAPPPVLAQEEFFGESKVTSVFLYLFSHPRSQVWFNPDFVRKSYF